MCYSTSVFLWDIHQLELFAKKQLLHFKSFHTCYRIIESALQCTVLCKAANRIRLEKRLASLRPENIDKLYLTIDDIRYIIIDLRLEVATYRDFISLNRWEESSSLRCGSSFCAMIVVCIANRVCEHNVGISLLYKKLNVINKIA